MILVMMNGDTSMFDCLYIDSCLALGNGKSIYSSKIGKKKVKVA